MSDMVKIILAFLFIVIFISWCYSEYKKEQRWNKEMSKSFYESLHKRIENSDGDLASNYKYRDITEDAESLLGDWERVGESLRYAMSEMDKELADKDKKENEE